MKLFVTRHGETEYNAKHIISGISDIPLAQSGIEQAQKLASFLAEKQNEYKIKHIIVSSLSRARDTCSYIEKALCIKAIPDYRLHEVDFGKLEKTSTTSRKFLKIKANPFKRYPEGESLLEVAHRAYTVIEEVKQKYAPNNVLLVCHGLISAVISTYFKDYESIDDFLRYHIENCGLQIYEL